MKRCRPWSRRQFIAGIGGALVPLTGCRKPVEAPAVELPQVVADDGIYEWSGIGFGIDMSMELHGVTEADGAVLGERCERTIKMLEQAFSLYLEDSELSRLNRERVLQDPSPVFQDLLDRARVLEERTLGYYQPAIHGAWSWLQQQQFQITDADAWLRHCNAAKTSAVVRGEDGSIRLTDPLVQLSMNAIGQGYLADLVSSLVRQAGVHHALLHLGETFAIGHHPEGRRWTLGVTGTGTEAGMIGEMDLADAGLAVSANEPGRLLIDPVGRCLQSAERVAAVVSREGATVADAYATAFAVAPSHAWPGLAATLMAGGRGHVRVWASNRLVFEA